MIITHCYKIKPTCEQSIKINYWLELLRRHYNYALGQRLVPLRGSQNSEFRIQKF
ncbi:helix-turn-helix domain-containing protein [Dapis sp. BLCC M126]|uniref:helix-turn-helix domain-containing protein n=1 Tax=Dapis sp. BLCC M126 TaxID=3400189 RepID=UPI003CF3A67C